MRCKYSSGDLQARLDHSIVRYNGFPYKVRYAGDNDLELWTLRTSGGKCDHIIKSTDPLLDISTIPLGYVQVNKETVCYLSRRPVRLYKQGVVPDCLNFDYIGKGSVPRVTWSICSQAMEDMILGKYPSVSNAISDLTKSDDSKREIAISRDIALKWHPKLKLIYVFFKNTEVGFIVEGQRKVIVPSGEMASIISYFLAGFDWEIE